MFACFIHYLGQLLFGQRSLLLLSMLILAVALKVFYSLLRWTISPENDVKAMYDEEDDIAALFLGIGLVLKERQLLQRIFLRQPHSWLAESEKYVNQKCGSVGINLILTGTALRLSVQLTKIPENLLSQNQSELILFALGAVFCLIAVLLLLYLIGCLGRQIKSSGAASLGNNAE
ncbi:hypothetical protein [Azotosporobacter soli]|uniref:hypothetical protein n=1 Tax=Azotosporobacter soli TaxID=3055040 RepID=UPI0031FE7820